MSTSTINLEMVDISFFTASPKTMLPACLLVTPHIQYITLFREAMS